MTKHATNIRAFIEAAKSCNDVTVKAYCGLVVIELVLKEAVGLKTHDIPAALNKFSHKFAIGNLHGCKIKLNALSVQLSNTLKAISVQGVDGLPRFAPADSYPYIRYTRHAADGWQWPSTTTIQAHDLYIVVEETRNYLSNKFKNAI